MRDVATERVLFRGPDRTQAASGRRAILSPDGARVAGVNWQVAGRVVVWDVDSKKVAPTLPVDGIPGDGVAFVTPTKFVVRQSDGELRLWDLAAAAPTGQRIGATSSKSYKFVFPSPGGRLFAAPAEKSVRIWSSETGAEVGTVTPSGGAGALLALSPDGGLLAASDERGVTLFDTSSGAARHHLRGHAGAVRTAEFSPDGKRLFTGGHDQTVKVWDVNSGHELLTLRHEYALVAISISPDGNRLATQQQWDARGRIFDATPVP